MSADLAPLFRAALERDALELRTGELLAWTPATLENTVRVAGAQLENLPVLNAGTVQLTAGDTVALLRSGAAFVILGNLTST